MYKGNNPVEVLILRESEGKWFTSCYKPEGNFPPTERSNYQFNTVC